MKKLTLIISLFLSLFCNAQELNWGKDSTENKGDWMFLDHCIHTESYEEAREPLTRLLKNCPDVSESLYISGVKVYKKLVKTEVDPVKKKVYQDSVLMLFDKRLEYFGDSSTVYNRKCLYLWKYKRKTKDQNEIRSRITMRSLLN
jgi:hypothetical protein